MIPVTCRWSLESFEAAVFCLLFPAGPVVYVLNNAVLLFPFLQFQISSAAAEPLFSDKIPPEPCAIEP